MESKVFAGIKYAEFSWAGVGPMSSKYFAEHGATIVKIESHKRLDVLRNSSPFSTNPPNPDSSMMYGRYNDNKYCVTIDLHHPNGQRLAWKLIHWADIVGESFSPGTMKRFGLDYEAVRKVKPDIIYLSSSMQGEGGPHSAYAGVGMNGVNLCGFSEISGWPDRRSAAPHGAYTDFICPRFNAAAIIAALCYRRQTGKGQWIDQSQFESSLHFLAPPIMDYQINGKIFHRNGNRLPGAAPHGIFPCQGDDNWAAISVCSEEKWQKFCQAIGDPALAAREEFSSLSKREENQDELEKLVAAWTITHTNEEVEAIMQSAGVPAHKVSKPRDVYADPQLKSRNYFVPLNHPVMGMQKYEPQSCFILSKTPRQIKTPSPCLGQHNEYVFKELLGLSDDEIAEHLIDGSITTELPGEFKMSM
jgi:benzylsuccinate CoA-transferase BbsF subunit